MAVQDKLDDDMKVSTRELYHQVLKERIETSHDVVIQFEIVVMERFKNMLKNLVAACAHKKPDYIFFHVRANHYLRLVQPIGRIHGKYNEGSLKVNIGALKRRLVLDDYQAPIETFDKELTKHQHQHAGMLKRLYTKLQIHKLWNITRSVRAVLGILAGNLYYADSLYFKTISDCLNYTSAQGINIVLIGIVSRPVDRIDDWLSARLNNKFIQFSGMRALPYINVFGTHDESGTFLFKRDLIHLNETAHARLANAVYTIVIDQFNAPKQKSVSEAAIVQNQ